MRRVARSWTQKKHTKQPSCFRRYLWSPAWPFFTLEEAVDKLYGPTSPLILLIGFWHVSTLLYLVGPVVLSRVRVERPLFRRPIRLDIVQGGQTCAIQITWCLFPAASFFAAPLTLLFIYSAALSIPSAKCYATCCLLRKSIWGLSSDLPS